LCITHPNPSSLLKLQTTQPITRTKICCGTEWDDTCRSTITPSSHNTEHQSSQAPSTCSSTNKSALVYPPVSTRLATKKALERLKVQPRFHPTQCYCWSLCGSTVQSLTYDGKGDSSSSLSPAAHAALCVPCPGSRADDNCFLDH